MITKKGGKLFRKYMLNMLALIFTGMLLMSILFIALETGRWSEEQSINLRNNAETVTENVQRFLTEFNGFGKGSVSDSAAVNIVSNLMDNLSSANSCDLFMCDSNGNVILCREMAKGHGRDSCVNHSFYRIPSDIMAKASKGVYDEMTTLGVTLKVKNHVVAIPVQIYGKTLGVVFAVKPVFATLTQYVSQVARIMLISAIITLFVSTVIIYGLVYKITKPLKQMSYAAKQYADGDFSFKVSVSGDDELAELANAFNKMAISLSALESSRRSFVANVSHELKTPMTTIGGFIDGILDGTIEQEEEKKYLEIVSDEVKRLSRLVTGMLNMSKLEAGEMNINAREFDISNSIFKTVLNFEKKIEQKNLDILGLENMQSIKVVADEDMIMQVIYNLVDNAIKFTPESGFIDLNSFTDGEKVYVSIRNSGDGISRDELHKVFERFYKIDRSRSYDVKGAGLGLYIVKSIINLHRGEIKADSVEGEYTEFSFWIPLSYRS
ncbi:MAG: HAMP domain-containing histidine kinase [Clostridia bacterium]|nr:HAMP domain-containing histidine kinase [Clostridia bacterium]